VIKGVIHLDNHGVEHRQQKVAIGAVRAAKLQNKNEQRQKNALAHIRQTCTGGSKGCELAHVTGSADVPTTRW
jgi:hypothetical protein